MKLDISTQRCGVDERGQELGPGADASDGAVKVLAEGPVILQTGVGELVAFDVAPDILVGIELRAVGRKVMNGHARMREQEGPGRPRRVRAQSIPDQIDGATNVAEQMAQEPDRLSTADAMAVQLEVEAVGSLTRPTHPWPPDHRADRRDHAAVAVAVAQNWCQPVRRPSVRDVRDQAKSALVGKNDGRAARKGPF